MLRRGDSASSVVVRDSEENLEVCDWRRFGIRDCVSWVSECWREVRLDAVGFSMPLSFELAADFLLSPSLFSDSSVYTSSSIRPIAFSSSSTLSSSLAILLLALPLVIRYTPKNVNTQPPTNFPTLSAVADSKSRYKTALPIITERVKSTNCVGITWVESKRCNARFKYRICSRAVRTSTKTNKYVIGNVKVLQSVSESSDATPLVDRAV